MGSVIDRDLWCRARLALGRQLGRPCDVPEMRKRDAHAVGSKEYGR